MHERSKAGRRDLASNAEILPVLDGIYQYICTRSFFVQTKNHNYANLMANAAISAPFRGACGWFITAPAFMSRR